MPFTDEPTTDPAQPIAVSFGQPTTDNALPIAASFGQPTTDNAEPINAAFGEPTNKPAIPIGGDENPTPAIPIMPASFQPAFVDLKNNVRALSTIAATTGDVGKVLQGIVNGELKSYRVKTGIDDEALPGIVHAANYDETENPIVFVMV